MTNRLTRLIVLVILAIVMVGVIHMRGRYVFGGESLLFVSWLIWTIVSWRESR